MENIDIQYNALVRDILTSGEEVSTRATIDGKNISARELFGRTIKLDLKEGFPILTSKFVSFKAILHELIWILSGNTNIKYLKDNNINIWNSWAGNDGDVGPVYGKQLRYWAGTDEYHHDQIINLINDINSVKNNPYDSKRRRLILSTWKVDEIDSMNLPCCHGLITQFHLSTTGILSLSTFQRSADVMLGLPFNLTSYSLLLSIIAHLTKTIPGNVHYNIGNAHIYSNHYEVMQEQLLRAIHPMPELKISDNLVDIDFINYRCFTLLEYKHSGILKGRVAV